MREALAVNGSQGQAQGFRHGGSLGRGQFFLEQGFVRFYDERAVRRLFVGAGVPPERLALVDLGRDFLAIARP